MAVLGTLIHPSPPEPEPDPDPDPNPGGQLITNPPDPDPQRYQFHTQ